MKFTERTQFAGACAALLAFAMLILATLGARADADRIVVSLPAESVQFLPLYVAEDHDLFGANGLAVKLVHLAGVGTTNGVISGSVDFGFSNGASITRAAARGQKLIAIALDVGPADLEHAAAQGRGRRGPFRPNGAARGAGAWMAGRRFSMIGESDPTRSPRVIAKAGGLDPESVAVAPLVATEAVAALQRKAVDGMVIASPWRRASWWRTARRSRSPTVCRGDPPWLAPFAGGLVIARVQFCAEHRPVCVQDGLHAPRSRRPVSTIIPRTRSRACTSGFP